MTAAVLVVVVAASALVAAPTPAIADCPGPSVEHDAGDIGRGQSVTVWGSAFGDNCYDTGPPPPGEDTLGRPLTGVEIVIAQGGVEHVVARGAAGDDYSFTAEVTVPSSLAPGNAEIVVRAPGAVVEDLTPQPLIVTPAPRAEPSNDRPVAFGPVPGSTTSRGTRELPWWPFAAVGAGAAVASLVAVRRVRAGRA